MLRLDHVAYVASDIDEAARRINADLGLASYPGGTHDGIGTGNRVIPLGTDQYVEIIGVVQPEVAAANPIGRYFRDLAADGDALRAWCLATDDIDSIADRLGLSVTPWTRMLPDGGELRWRLAGVEAAMTDPALPFFIQWEDGAVHPGRVGATHRTEVSGISWIEVGADGDRLADWTEGADLPMRAVGGARGPRAVGIATADGEVVLS